jgi:hypothetical protein
MVFWEAPNDCQEFELIAGASGLVLPEFESVRLEVGAAPRDLDLVPISVAAIRLLYPGGERCDDFGVFPIGRGLRTVVSARGWRYVRSRAGNGFSHGERLALAAAGAPSDFDWKNWETHVLVGGRLAVSREFEIRTAGSLVSHEQVDYAFQAKCLSGGVPTYTVELDVGRPPMGQLTLWVSGLGLESRRLEDALFSTSGDGITLSEVDEAGRVLAVGRRGLHGSVANDSALGVAMEVPVGFYRGEVRVSGSDPVEMVEEHGGSLIEIAEGRAVDVYAHFDGLGTAVVAEGLSKHLETSFFDVYRTADWKLVEQFTPAARDYFLGAMQSGSYLVFGVGDDGLGYVLLPQAASNGRGVQSPAEFEALVAAALEGDGAAITVLESWAFRVEAGREMLLHERGVGSR